MSLRATHIAQLIVAQHLKPGAIALDATVGNGHDTLFLAHCVGPTGSVVGFDVQATAIAAAQKLLVGLTHVTLIHAGHETLAKALPASAHGQLSAVMFNLGYLPGASKHIITAPQTTLAALVQALDHLAPGGIATVIIYPGHDGGADEAAQVRRHLAALRPPFVVAQWARLKARDPAPLLLVITRS